MTTLQASHSFHAVGVRSCSVICLPVGPGLACCRLLLRRDHRLCCTGVIPGIHGVDTCRLAFGASQALCFVCRTMGKDSNIAFLGGSCMSHSKRCETFHVHHDACDGQGSENLHFDGFLDAGGSVCLAGCAHHYQTLLCANTMIRNNANGCKERIPPLSLSSSSGCWSCALCTRSDDWCLASLSRPINIIIG